MGTSSSAILTIQGPESISGEGLLSKCEHACVCYGPLCSSDIVTEESVRVAAGSGQQLRCMWPVLEHHSFMLACGPCMPLITQNSRSLLRILEGCGRHICWPCMSTRTASRANCRRGKSVQEREREKGRRFALTNACHALAAAAALLRAITIITELN